MEVMKGLQLEMVKGLGPHDTPFLALDMCISLPAPTGPLSGSTAPTRPTFFTPVDVRLRFPRGFMKVLVHVTHACIVLSRTSHIPRSLGPCRRPSAPHSLTSEAAAYWRGLQAQAGGSKLQLLRECRSLDLGPFRGAVAGAAGEAGGDAVEVLGRLQDACKVRWVAEARV